MPLELLYNTVKYVINEKIEISRKFNIFTIVMCIIYENDMLIHFDSMWKIAALSLSTRMQLVKTVILQRDFDIALRLSGCALTKSI